MKSSQAIQKLPTFDRPLLIWAFIPCLSEEQDFSKTEFDPSCFQEELEKAFAELDVAWKLKLVTLNNMRLVIEEVVASRSQYFPVVLNYCTGLDEIDGLPGASVVKLLEAKGVPFTGADSQFFKIGDSKILMKQAFVEVGVSTSPYEVIKDVNGIQGLCDRLIPPLIVKPSTSFGGRGISLKSVVHTDEEAIVRFEHLRQGQHEIQISAGGIFVEQFIKGREFTVFLIGTYLQQEQIEIYPPLEMMFSSSIPKTEQFYTRELWTGEAERRMSPLNQESLCSYQLAPTELRAQLCDLAKRAYCAVNGTGYGRVDIRMDETTQEIFVLEVNPNPAVTSKSLALGLNEPNTTQVGAILHLAKLSFTHMILTILDEALSRHTTQSLSPYEVV